MSSTKNIDCDYEWNKLCKGYNLSTPVQLWDEPRGEVDNLEVDNLEVVKLSTIVEQWDDEPQDKFNMGWNTCWDRASIPVVELWDKPLEEKPQDKIVWSVL